MRYVFPHEQRSLAWAETNTEVWSSRFQFVRSDQRGSAEQQDTRDPFGKHETRVDTSIGDNFKSGVIGCGAVPNAINEWSKLTYREMFHADIQIGLRSPSETWRYQARGICETRVRVFGFRKCQSTVLCGLWMDSSKCDLCSDVGFLQDVLASRL